MGIGNEADKLLEGPKDFMVDSFEFIKKNLDRILMITIIFFLVLSWTTIFEWEFPNKKNVILKKNIRFKDNNVKMEGFNLKNKIESSKKTMYVNDKKIKTRDEILNEIYLKECDPDNKECETNNRCLELNPGTQCWNDPDCCVIKSTEHKYPFCVKGDKNNGPYYNSKNSVKKWQYLGNNYNS
jgi:hypothetical protein